MNVMKMAIGGIIGGLVGAAIWAAIGYFTGYEVGWIAWGVGALAGVGVRLVGAQRLANDTTAGAIAAIAAIVSVLVGKYAVVHLFFGSAAEAFSDYADDETMIAYLADEIAYDLESQGRTVDWPPGMDYESAREQKDYPPEIWSEAASKWNALSETDKESSKQARAEALGTALVDTEGARSEMFLGSFGVYDLLWFGLAALTAFKISAGTGE